MSEVKNCMNCQHRIGGRNECLLNEGMKVNRRMVCEEWRSDDIIGAAVVAAQTDLQSGCTEYKDLQSETKRITNAYTHSGRIANPTEQQLET